MSTRFWVRCFVVMVIVLVMAIVVLLYRDHQRYALESALVPIVQPDVPETKVHPKDPEGMDIPNTELSIYEHLDDKKSNLPKIQTRPPAPIVITDQPKDDPVDTHPQESEVPPQDTAPQEEDDQIPFMPASSLKGAMMDLGFFSTQEEANQAWARAKTALPPSFGASRPMMVRDQGTFHLYVVNIPDLGQGGEVCSILTKIGLFCQVTGP